MIKITDKSKCCGCGACYNICPNNSILMKIDNEGFYYPHVNIETCLNCNLCNQVCPKENNYQKNKDYKYFFIGGYNRNKEILKQSSSGGIFWLLAEYIISCKGFVYGVELGENFYLFHNRATTLEECEKFRKSKYLESDMNTIYRKVRLDLDNNSKVLFTGTPCQIAGLYSYLGKEYSNLYTCDVVCHGVPSRVVFNKYIEELNIVKKTKAISICWRDKENGWGPNKVAVYFDNGTQVRTISMKNPYQKGFLINLFLRPSCYTCSWAKLPRVGDISLADFWGYKGKLLKKNVNEGLSIIIVSSEKGKTLFEEIKKFLEYEFVSEKFVTMKSRHVYMPPKKNSNREAFFKDFNKYSFEKLSKKYIYNITLRKILSAIKWEIYKIIKK